MPRVWIHGANKWGDLGARRWVVEWWTMRPEASSRIVAAAPNSADADADPDTDFVCHYKAFKTKDAAANYAQMLVDADKTAHGESSVYQQEVVWFVKEDQVAKWEQIGETEYFSSVSA